MVGHLRVKYVAIRSTPKICGMDFPLEVEHAREISQVRRVACGPYLYMPCLYVSCI